MYGQMVLAQAPSGATHGGATPVARFTTPLHETQPPFETTTVFDFMLDWRFLVGIVLVLILTFGLWWFRGQHLGKFAKPAMGIGIAVGVGMVGWGWWGVLGPDEEAQLVAQHEAVYEEAVIANKSHIFEQLDTWYGQTDITSREVCTNSLQSVGRTGSIHDEESGMTVMKPVRNIDATDLLQCGGEKTGTLIAPVAAGNAGGGTTRAIVTTVADDGIYIEMFTLDVPTATEFERQQNKGRAIGDLTRAIAEQGVKIW